MRENSMGKQRGFTLIELMIVVAVLGILAAIGYPSYTDYLRRGYIAEATSSLADWRARLETYYLDNRNYGTAGACGVAAPGGKYFGYTCATDGQSYTLTANGGTGNGSMTGFVYTINNQNVRATTISGVSGWNGSFTCWVVKKGGVC